MARADRAAIVDRARALVGVRFRLHGRNPRWGLDCVGVAMLAYRLDAVPAGYALRGGEAAAILRDAMRLGFVPATIEEAGDLLVMRPAPLQFHLGVASERGVVHAHAGLRRVVETPGPAAWPVIARLAYGG